MWCIARLALALFVAMLYAPPVALAQQPTRPAKPLTADEEHSLKPKDPFKECDDCPEMVVVPAGEFLMGSPASEAGRDADEGPQRKVTIAKPFAAGKFEVTFAEWDACVAAGECKHKPDDEGWGRGKWPVVNVSWDDITKEYLPWLSRTTGKPYRLLTEAEWEYAARAGTTTPFSTGETITFEQANFGIFPGKPVEVGSYPPNAFGLHDMTGNVEEWVADCAKNGRNSYAGAPVDGSAATSGDCRYHLLRGGHWGGIEQKYLRTANRTWASPTFRHFYEGFRVARSLTP